ncbi:MAG: beta-N-acetylhexosaminidase [Salegentibacter sp.]|uniref:beta-N-acetylhexosaminidase n=1 Tax=Salegentibacter sp. TaxID=1903072 RepID=UPI00286FBD15|nr:beta-N-acetylhexosaminidase [Salegentibacter sp.]MDR9455776.1 beta-N-acetylhexosaminidase [Salegentibacter sp.]
MKSHLLKKTILFLLITVLLSSCSGSPEVIKAEGPPPSVIPLPQSVEWKDNMYLIPEVNHICYNNGGEKTAEWLQQLLKAANIESEINSGESCGNWNISIDSALQEELGEEGYTLEINDSGVTINSATEAGSFYAIQSLRQFFPAEIEQGNFVKDDVLLRQTFIQDKPEYSWRGTMVDVARSFFGIDYLKQHVDRMALYKLNRLHLHLTDDQGWRIEIKGKPLLTEIGSKGSVEGGRSGYLTQEEYKELQDYALERNIVIIPEVDMPGHIYSALLAYPELNCPGNSNIGPKGVTPPELYTGYEVGWSKFCLEKPEIYDFVSDVIRELSNITKGPWIHIGGDEIEDPRYEEFVVKADSIVQQHGKLTIGWQEITQAPVSPNAISQKWWAGHGESVVNVKEIQSFCSNFYLDHANVPGQENTLNWCKETGVSIEDVYSFSSNDPNVIGVEAPVWTEHVLSDEMLDDRFWPRTLAVAEVGWTLESKRDFKEFLVRVAGQGERLNNLGIHYFDTPNVQWNQRNIAERPESVFHEFMPSKEKIK